MFVFSNNNRLLLNLIEEAVTNKHSKSSQPWLMIVFLNDDLIVWRGGALILCTVEWVFTGFCWRLFNSTVCRRTGACVNSHVSLSMRVSSCAHYLWCSVKVADVYSASSTQLYKLGASEIFIFPFRRTQKTNKTSTSLAVGKPMSLCERGFNRLLCGEVTDLTQKRSPTWTSSNPFKAEP